MKKKLYKTWNWKKKRQEWLSITGHRCSMFPFLKGVYFHHIHYENFGDENLWDDVILLSRFAHYDLIHGLLSGWKKPKDQNNYDGYRYENIFQRLAHGWCRLNRFL